MVPRYLITSACTVDYTKKLFKSIDLIISKNICFYNFLINLINSIPRVVLAQACIRYLLIQEIIISKLILFFAESNKFQVVIPYLE